MTISGVSLQFSSWPEEGVWRPRWPWTAEYTQHSDSIISWRSSGLHWDAFQMCLNNRGIELPPKMSAGNKGKQLIIPPFSANNHLLSLGRSLHFSVILSFFPSLYSFISLFPSVHFWSRSFRFSHTLPCHTGRPQKCRTEESVRGLWNSTCGG